MKQIIRNATNKYNGLPLQVKASLWFLMCSFFQKALSVIYTPIYTRILSTEEYGLYNVFNTWLAIMTVFVSLNLSAGVYTQGLVKLDREDEKNAFTSSLQSLTFIISAIWLVILITIKKHELFLLSFTTYEIVAMVVLIWSTAAYNFWAAEQRVKLNYKRLVFLTIIVSIMTPILSIILIINSHNKVDARITGELIVSVLAYSFLFLSHIKRGNKIVHKEYWLYALSFNIPLIPHYLSQTVLNGADRIMINSMVGSEEAGIYSLAYSVSNIMLLFNVALLQTINPWIYQKIKDKRTEDIKGVANICLLIIGFVNLVLILLAPEAIRIFAPSEYYDAIWIVPPVAISGFFIFMYSLFADFEFYYKKTVFVMIASIFAAALNVLLNYVFIGIFGYIAAGYTTLVCYIIYSYCHYAFMRRICKQYLNNVRVYDARFIMILSILFIVLGFLIMAMYRTSILRYSVIGIVLICVYIFRKTIINQLQRIIQLKKNDKKL